MSRSSLAGFCRENERTLISATLLLGLLVRLPFLATDFHTNADPALFRTWGRAIVDGGLPEIYSEPGVNYLPVLLYLFGAAAFVESHVPDSLRMGDGLIIALIKLPAAVADVLTAGLLAWALRGRPPAIRVLVPALYLFNPAIWYVGAHWGQMESIYTLFLVAAFVALERGATVSGWGAFALAIATKTQSVVLLPLLAVVTLRRFGFAALLRGVLVGCAVVGALAAPWLLAGTFGALARAYTTLPEEVLRVDVTAYNLWYLLLAGRVQGVLASHHPLGLPLSYGQLGTILLAPFLIWMVFVSWRKRGLWIVPAAACTVGVFVLAMNMRERYLFPALVFVLLGAAGYGGARNAPVRSRALWLAYGVFSLTFLFNLATIAPFADVLGPNLVATDANSLRLHVLKLLALVAAAANVATLGLLVWVLRREEAADGEPRFRDESPSGFITLAQERHGSGGPAGLQTGEVV